MLLFQIIYDDFLLVALTVCIDLKKAEQLLEYYGSDKAYYISIFSTILIYNISSVLYWWWKSTEYARLSKITNQLNQF